MRIAIVEDEAVVARRLERMIRAILGADADPLTRAASLPEALEVVASTSLDLVFLDLNLGGASGFDLLEAVSAARFQTIVVSAHHAQALRAFEYGVTDFVAKPFTEARLRKAIDRALGREASARPPARCLGIRKGREVRMVALEGISFIRGADDFSELHVEGGISHLHARTLAALEALLPEDFVRIHRSYIANLSRARGIRGTNLVLADGRLLPIGRSYRDGVRARLGLV